MEKMRNKNIPTHTFVVCAYKESPYLESCIQSLLNQQVKSNIVISTGTPNAYISKIAEKYQLPLWVNEKKNRVQRMIGTMQLTVQEQNQLRLRIKMIYMKKNYLKCILQGYKRAKNPIILFTDYGELRNGKTCNK